MGTILEDVFLGTAEKYNQKLVKIRSSFWLLYIFQAHRLNWLLY